jgi:ubiquinone/menaquinone biosynthesis C-methylase UbiE
MRIKTQQSSEDPLMTDRSISELRGTWERAAPGWAKWEHVISAGLGDSTEMLLDMAGVQPGMRVLDIACGAGSQTIRAAQRVGADGSVVASDISATMLNHLREHAARAGLDNIETLECAAEELSGAHGPFDAAICRVGLMLFSSPPAALEAVQRVLKPGARIAALVFTTPAENSFMAQPMAILLRHAGKSPPPPGQPGIFALGGECVLEDLLAGSGLVDVEIRQIGASLRLASASAAIEMMQEAFGAYRAVVADLSEDERANAWGQVHKYLKGLEGEDGFKAELTFVIGSGAKRG